MNPIALFSIVVIICDLLWFSRLAFLAYGPIATLGAAPPLFALIIGMIGGHRTVPRPTGLIIYSFVILTAAWIYTFYTNTGLIGDLRAFANIGGMLCFFAFLFCFKTFGPTKTLNYLYYMAVAYVVIYTTASIMLISGAFSGAPPSVVMRDPARGSRLFAASALIAFALFRIVHELKHTRNLALNIPLLAVTLVAIYLQKSRISIVLYLLCALLLLFGRQWQRMLVAKATILGFIVYAVLAALAEPLIADFIRSFNDPSMSLRLQTFGIAYDNFLAYPVFGLGLPSQPDFYQRLFGPLYFPEDLGVLGLMGSYGLVGLGWVVGLALLLSKAVVKIGRDPRSNYVALTHVVIFGFLTLFFSQNIFQGDGGVMSSAALALHAYVLRVQIVRRRRLRQTTPAAFGGDAVSAGMKA